MAQNQEQMDLAAETARMILQGTVAMLLPHLASQATVFRNNAVINGNQALRGAVQHTAKGLDEIEDKRTSANGVEDVLLERHHSALQQNLIEDLSGHGIKNAAKAVAKIVKPTE